jgi:hypothetical protein
MTLAFAAVSSPWVMWLFPVAFTLHNIEEAIWLPAFSQRAGRFHPPVARGEFLFALVPITLLGWFVTGAFALYGRQSLAGDLFYAFNLVMAVNVVFPHLAATVVLRRYCPGLITGIVFLMPSTVYLLSLGYDRGDYSLTRLLLIVPLLAAFLVGAIQLLSRIGRHYLRG